MEVQSLSDLARDHIMKRIARGDLAPGQQIKEEEIASGLNISRPPVREAFKGLEAEGLVVRRPRRGVFVTEMTLKDVWEVYTLKAHLYAMAVDIALDRFHDQHITHLGHLVDEMESCVSRQPPDLLRYQKLHHAYHHLILEVAANERLTQFASTLHLQIQRFSYRTLQDTRHLRESIRFHQDILSAIRRRERAKACRLMKTHVLEALEVAAKLIAPTHEALRQGDSQATAEMAISID
ncbi:MAG: GntR family transcriptional regulator [Desulfobacterales bacterium]